MRRAHKRRQSETRNARFWYYWNGGFIKLTLREGQTVDLGRSEPTDEGYHYEHDELSHEGDRVLLRWETGGRDCDGVTSQEGKSAAPLDRLAVKSHDFGTGTGELRSGAQNAQLMLPEWKEVGHVRVYDQFAQAMGY
jgi:hypothetical protein